MAMRIGRTILALLLVVALAWPPAPALACGPFFPEALFTFYSHPDFPLPRFARGKLGVLQPGYGRSYLYVAYRQLQGEAFSQTEQQALELLWGGNLNRKVRETGRFALPQNDWVKKWLVARTKVRGAQGKVALESYGSPGILREEKRGDRYLFYNNCLQGAFENAVKTLKARIAQFGADSPALKGWVEAQDKVFANCGGEPPRTLLPVLPDAAKPVDPPLIHADRAYQIAAAHFYSGNLDEARKRFENIGQDASSPWRQIAPYLVARTLIRKATLNEPADVANQQLLAEAETRLKRVLADPGAAKLQPAARSLLGFIAARLRPSERTYELSQALMQKSLGGNFGQDLIDYVWLLDHFTDVRVPWGSNYAQRLAEARARRLAVLSSVRGRDDLTDWILAFEALDAEALKHSIEKWEHTKSLPWLVASLAKVRAGHLQARDLLTAAEKVTPTSPAYLTVAFHRFRLLAESGSENEARAKLDELLSVSHGKLPRSSLNLFLALRMKLAQNLNEFLRYAPRVPAATVYWDEYSLEFPDYLKDPRHEKASAKPPGSLLDADSAVVFTEKLPLRLLTETARSATLPASLRRHIAIAAWVRSVILEDEETGKETARVLEQLVPELKPSLDAYQSAPSTEARKFAGVLALLRFPGMRPYVVPGLGRTTPFAKIDSYRDNWWCSFAPPRPGEWNYYTMSGRLSEALKAIYPGAKIDFPGFLNASQRDEATKQMQQLAARDTAPNYLTAHALTWAKKHPDDLRVPEALHLAVRATRYGCTDKETGKLSKAAFELLHKRYPQSAWAKKTKYWFGPSL